MHRVRLFIPRRLVLSRELGQTQQGALDLKYDLEEPRSKLRDKQKTKPSTSLTEITTENRESEAKKDVRDLIPNPMPQMWQWPWTV